MPTPHCSCTNKIMFQPIPPYARILSHPKNMIPTISCDPIMLNPMNLGLCDHRAWVYCEMIVSLFIWVYSCILIASSGKTIMK